MPKPVIYGASLGLFAGVLLGTIGGSSIMEEIIMQMVFGLIAGIGIGVCYHILTREKGENETFLPTPGAEPQKVEGGGQGSIAIWLIPLISILAAVIKGFVVGTKLGQ